LFDGGKFYPRFMRLFQETSLTKVGNRLKGKSTAKPQRG